MGRRGGRNTTHQAEAYGADLGQAIPHMDMEPDATGVADGDAADGFRSPTAMFDRGEFLGELADEMGDGVPDTRASVEVEQAPKGCKLIVVGGPDLGTEWGFKQPEVGIGRSSENEIDFQDIAVSRNHARIELSGGAFYLKDLGSNNGTILNGIQIEREQVFSGDEIIIGERTLRFVELDEAPPTAAAYPVTEPAPEPVAGSPSELVHALGGEEPDIGDVSQVDADVVSSTDGPDLGGDLPEGSEVAVPIPARPKRTAMKLLVLVAGVLSVLAVVGYGGLLGYRHFRGIDPEAAATKANRDFLQGIALVKALRCGDAIVLFDAVLKTRPEYDRAKEYKAHCESELAAWNAIEAARRLAAVDRYPDAIEQLKQVGQYSGYRPRAVRLLAAWNKKINAARMAEARSLFESGDIDGALDVVNEALSAEPTLAAARDLRETIEELRRPVEVVPQKRQAKKSAVPPLMRRAVSLYTKGRISAAIDAAEVAGGRSARNYIDQMKEVQRLLKVAARAHRMKAAAELLRVTPRAMDLDAKLGAGRGKIREKIRTYYADGLYLKGLEAFNDQDYVRAFRLLKEAVRVMPRHRLSTTTLSLLSRKARKLYYNGFATKDSAPTRTRKIFEKVKAMTDPHDDVHQWASEWLAANPG